MVAVFALLALAIAMAGEPVLRRDGSAWTQTEQGAYTLDPTGQLKIKAPGNIRVRGAKGSQVTYKLVRSVRARSQAEARAVLSRYTVNFTSQNRFAALQMGMGSFGMDLEINVPRTLESVIVETPGGNLDIGDLSGSVVAEAAGGKISVGHVGGDVEIRTAGGETSISSVGGLVRCLSGGGGITADQIHGDALFQTGAGDIILHRCDGQVRAYTAGGAIQVVDARGAVIANTGGGPIQVGSASSVQCESNSGAIRLNNVAGAMQASTAIGSIIAQFLPGFPVMESFLSTGSGDITVLIPSNLRLSIRAQNDGSGNVGTVVSEFPSLRVRSVGSAVLAEGRINGGGPLLRLTGSGGRIYIKKQ